jgi:hypothetical protein
VEHGSWAIAGARQGTDMIMLTDWDYTQVKSFDALEILWQQNQNREPDMISRDYEDALKTQLDLPMCMMMPIQSKFFKRHYRSNWMNQGIMVREIDVIRNQEGW